MLHMKLDILEGGHVKQICRGLEGKGGGEEGEAVIMMLCGAQDRLEVAVHSS